MLPVVDIMVVVVVVVVPADAAVVAPDLVAVVVVLVVGAALLAADGDHLGLLRLVHVDVDGDVVVEVAVDQDVDIVDVDPHIVSVLGMLSLDFVQRISRGGRVLADPLLGAVRDDDLLLLGPLQVQLPQRSPPSAGRGVRVKVCGGVVVVVLRVQTLPALCRGMVVFKILSRRMMVSVMMMMGMSPLHMIIVMLAVVVPVLVTVAAVVVRLLPNLRQSGM